MRQIERTPPSGAGGFTLVEVLVALLLITIGVLAVAPMFVYAGRGTASSGDYGTVGALAVERLEQLRETHYSLLDEGGSLTSNVAGYYDTSEPGFVVRWEIEDNISPTLTKTITLRAMSLRSGTGPRRDVTLITLRGY